MPAEELLEDAEEEPTVSCKGSGLEISVLRGEVQGLRKKRV